MSENNENKLSKFSQPIFLALGLGLLAVVLLEADPVELWETVLQVGWWGMAFVLILYTVEFLLDVVGWQVAFESIPFTARWAGRLYLVRMIGEAINNATPTASLGGEPVKAWLLRSHYGIGYRESSATIILAKTTNMIGLILFLGVGFALLMGSPGLADAYKAIAGTGLVALSLGTILFFSAQRLRFSSLAGGRLSQTRLGQRLARLWEIVRDVDDHLVRFYTCHRARFTTALILALLNWVLGVVEIYFVMDWLGHPISFLDAWIIEAMAQLVRTGAFFIPAGIGVQEGTFLIFCTAITGNPTVGLAVSVVRRTRELLWILAGLAIWSRFSIKLPAKLPEPAPESR